MALRKITYICGGLATALMAAWPVAASAATMSAGSAIHSPSFAGYQVVVAGTKASAKFKLPSLTCTSTNSGFVPTLEFTNYASGNFTSGGVDARCANGQASYVAFAEVNNQYQNLPEPVQAGNVMQVRLSASSSSSAVTVADLTAKSANSASGSGAAFTGMSIGDNGSAASPVPPFKSLFFSKVTVNGMNFGTVPSRFAYNRYSGKILQISTAPLNKAGSGFSTKFKHS